MADLRSLAANFKKYLGEYRPFVSLNHDDGLRFGRITDCYLDGDTLYLDAEGIPVEVGRWVNEGKLAEPSIEFWSGPDYVGKDGRPATGRVLKSLTLLGNQPPAVKGMPPLPAATFAHRGTVRRFAGTPGRPAGMSPRPSGRCCSPRPWAGPPWSGG
jgi:hypothetical protein